MTSETISSGTAITPERAAAFLRDFATMSEFGATPGGGVDRQAAGEADVAQRRWFAELLTAHGLRVEYDRIGNQSAFSA
jgi:N-carbamoyl-L-amino-acid hydrolase